MSHTGYCVPRLHWGAVVSGLMPRPGFSKGVNMNDAVILVLIGWTLFAVNVLIFAYLRLWLERDTKAIQKAEEIDRNWP